MPVVQTDFRLYFFRNEAVSGNTTLYVANIVDDISLSGSDWAAAVLAPVPGSELTVTCYKGLSSFGTITFATGGSAPVVGTPSTLGSPVTFTAGDTLQIAVNTTMDPFILAITIKGVRT